jgi:hypothetical protein
MLSILVIKKMQNIAAGTKKGFGVSNFIFKTINGR